MTAVFGKGLIELAQKNSQTLKEPDCRHTLVTLF